MNLKQLIRDSRLRARDLLAGAFTAEQWVILLNDANDMAGALARRADPSYFNRIQVYSGTIVDAGYAVPADLAATLDVRIFFDTGMIHADPVTQLSDPGEVNAGQPRWILKGDTLFVREGFTNRGSVTRVELEYQRSVPRLFGAKVTAVGGAGTLLTVTESAPSNDDAFEGDVILRDSAYVGAVIEPTSGADKWKRAKVTAQTGAVLTVAPALPGVVVNDLISSIPLYPEDLHAFLPFQAVLDAYSAEDNVRGVAAIKPRHDIWEDRFKKGIESRVEGRRAPLADVTEAGTYY